MNTERAVDDTLSAFKFRGVMYYYLFDEMKREFGREKAREVFKRATYRKGVDIQKNYKKSMDNLDFKGLAKDFCDLSAANGSIFHPGIEEVNDNEAIITMASCPLVESWKELGLSPEEIDEMCEVSSAIDYGTFESYVTKLAFSHRIGSGDKMCRLIVSKK